MIRTFRIIRHEYLADAILLGWMPAAALVGTCHGEYSCLCEWLCDCPPPVPGAAS